MFKPCEHSANFTIFALGQHNLKYRSVTPVVNYLGPACPHFAFRKPDTVGQFTHQFLPGIAGHCHAIGLFNTIFWM
jgi:hypothetical protein